jgi:MinD superfamily P-loop ATPase
MSAQHDLERVIELIGHFKIPVLVCINKFDINVKKAKEIETNLNSKGINVAAMIPYDNVVTKAQVARQSVVEYADNGMIEKIKSLWQAVLDVLNIKENN